MGKTRKRPARRWVAVLTALLAAAMLSAPALALEARDGELTIQAAEIVEDGEGKAITLAFDNQSGRTVQLGWGGDCTLSVTTSEGTYSLRISGITAAGPIRIMSGTSTQTFAVSPCPGEVEQIALAGLRALEPGSRLPDYQLNEAVIYQADEPDGYIWDIDAAAEQEAAEADAWQEQWESMHQAVQDIQDEAEDRLDAAAGQAQGRQNEAVQDQMDDFGAGILEMQGHILKGVELGSIFAGLIILIVVCSIGWNLLNPNSTVRRKMRLERLAVKRQLEEEERYASGKRRAGSAGQAPPTENAAALLRQNQEQLERYWKRYCGRTDEARSQPDDISIAEEAQGIARNLLTVMVRGIWLSRTGTLPQEQGEENRLEAQINRLADNGYITPRSRGNYHKIRKICNAGAHAEWTAASPEELFRLVSLEVILCVMSYNRFLSGRCRDYLSGKLPEEEMRRMDDTALWQFVREMLEGIDMEGPFGGGAHAGREGTSGAGTGRQDWWFLQWDQEEFQRQMQLFQQEVLRTQQEEIQRQSWQAQQQAAQQAQLFQQGQIDHFNWQSANTIPDGGFVPPPPPPPTDPF